jgi:hypothetical protein
MWHFPRRWNLIPFKSAIAVIAGRKHAAFLWKILYLDVFIFLSLSRKAPNDVPFESGSAPKKNMFRDQSAKEKCHHKQDATGSNLAHGFSLKFVNWGISPFDPFGVEHQI